MMDATTRRFCPLCRSELCAADAGGASIRVRTAQGAAVE